MRKRRNRPDLDVGVGVGESRPQTQFVALRSDVDHSATHLLAHLVEALPNQTHQLQQQHDILNCCMSLQSYTMLLRTPPTNRLQPELVQISLSLSLVEVDEPPAATLVLVVLPHRLDAVLQPQHNTCHLHNQVESKRGRLFTLNTE